MKTHDLLSFAGQRLGNEHYSRTYSLGDIQRMRGRVNREGKNWLVFEECDVRADTVADLRSLGYRVVFAGNQTIVSWPDRDTAR